MSKAKVAEMDESDYLNSMASLRTAKTAIGTRNLHDALVLIDNAQKLLEKYKPQAINDREKAWEEKRP